MQWLTITSKGVVSAQLQNQMSQAPQKHSKTNLSEYWFSNGICTTGTVWMLFFPFWPNSEYFASYQLTFIPKYSNLLLVCPEFFFVFVLVFLYININILFVNRYLIYFLRDVCLINRCILPLYIQYSGPIGRYKIEKKTSLSRRLHWERLNVFRSMFMKNTILQTHCAFGVLFWWICSVDWHRTQTLVMHGTAFVWGKIEEKRKKKTFSTTNQRKPFIVFFRRLIVYRPTSHTHSYIQFWDWRCLAVYTQAHNYTCISHAEVTHYKKIVYLSVANSIIRSIIPHTLSLYLSHSFSLPVYFIFVYCDWNEWLLML